MSSKPKKLPPWFDLELIQHWGIEKYSQIKGVNLSELESLLRKLGYRPQDLSTGDGLCRKSKFKGIGKSGQKLYYCSKFDLVVGEDPELCTKCLD